MTPMLAELMNILNGEHAVLAIIFFFGSIIAVTTIVFTTIHGIAVARAKEATKRELAAYVAEGTMQADEAVAILESDKPVWEKGRKPRKA